MKWKQPTAFQFVKQNLKCKHPTLRSGQYLSWIKRIHCDQCWIWKKRCPTEWVRFKVVPDPMPRHVK